MSHTTEKKHTAICKGGPLDETEFSYTGSNHYHKHADGFYLKTNQTNESDQIVWIWRTSKPK